jgi:acyl-CoA thioester hydrolase
MKIVPCESRFEVLPEWTDRNGHLNVAYYVLAFDYATEALLDQLGIGARYHEREGRSLFTLSMNVDYLREVFVGDGLRVVSRLIDHDHKCMRYFHEMHHAQEGYLAATNELLAIHVNMATRRSEPFPPDVRERLGAWKSAHAELPLPPQVGRKLGIRAGRQVGQADAPQRG